MPPGGEGPTYSPNSWDVVFIDDEPLPGVSKIKGLPTLSIDKKKANGVDGATITVNGYLPGPIEIETTLWTVEQWEFFLVMVPKLWRRPNKKATFKELAKTISNPATDVFGITQIVIIGISVPEDGPVRGTKIVRIKAHEYVPSQKGNKTKTVKSGAKVAQTKEHRMPANAGGEAPSLTDTGPTGAKKAS
jgi:hypothetical protein